MIVELRNAGCTVKAAGSARQAMAHPRADLVAAWGEPSGRWRTLDGTAVFIGVGFVHTIHGQTGGAPNGIELHPVMRVSRAVCTGG